jgi:type III pantothenate kinase
MVGVIDIGNTHIHCGLYEGETLVERCDIPTGHKNTLNKVKKVFQNKRIEGMAIASVVPTLLPLFRRYSKKNFHVVPLVVSSKLDCNVVFKYYRPETLGADRIAHVVGGLARYKRNMIVIDFGTATTLDVVLRNGTYLGGIIMPGIGIARDVLSERTALLKRVVVRKPNDIIGRSTEECIQSGVFQGTVLMVRGFIREIRKMTGKRFYCVATGGWGALMSSHIKEIAAFDPHLALFGILKIYHYNV